MADNRCKAWQRTDWYGQRSIGQDVTTPVQDEGRPDRPAGISIKIVHTSLGIGKALPSAGDLELHEPLPPVVYAPRCATEHPCEHLPDHQQCQSCLGTRQHIGPHDKFLGIYCIASRQLASLTVVEWGNAYSLACTSTYIITLSRCSLYVRQSKDGSPRIR